MNVKKFSDAMSELDTKYVDEALNYKKKAKRPNWIKWGAIAACLAFVLMIGIPQLIDVLPFTHSSPQGMYKIGTPWETDQFTFCVVDATFCNEYQTETGDIITPDEGCRFIAVEYYATYAQNVTLSECTLKKGDAYSEPHSAYMLPIRLSGDNIENKGNYLLLFSIPLSESDADTPSQHSYSLSVEIDTGTRTYVEEFSLS